jgi:hypothetical protein
VSLLDLGADDYLVKPFDLRELDARLRAIVRRPSGHQSSQNVSWRSCDRPGSLRIAAVGASRRRHGPEGVPSSRASGDLGGRVVTRERLMSRLFDIGDGGSENALELLVSRVRRKIAASTIEVVTVRGVGYLARVSEDAEPLGNRRSAGGSSVWPRSMLAASAALLMLFIHDYARQSSDRAFDRLLSASALSIAGAVLVEDGAVTLELPSAALDMVSGANASSTPSWAPRGGTSRATPSSRPTCRWPPEPNLSSPTSTTTGRPCGSRVSAGSSRPRPAPAG